MSTDNLYYPHAINFNDSLPPLTQISNVRSAFNDTDISETCASGVAPEFLGYSFSAPDITWDTMDLLYVIARCQGLGNGIAGDFTAGDVDLEYKAGKNLATRETNATAAHVIGKVANAAMLNWSTISVTSGEKASISASIVTAWDEVANDVLVFSNDQVLTTDCDVNGLYGMGPTAINGVRLKGVKSVSWKQNVELKFESDGGAARNTYVEIASVKPEVTIQSTHIDYMSTLNKQPLTGTGLQCSFRQYAEDPVYYADTDTRHITMQAQQGLVRARQVSDSPAMVELSVRLKYNSATRYYDFGGGVAIGF